MAPLRARTRAAHWAVYAQVYDTLWDCAHTERTALRVVGLCRELGAARVIEVGAGTGLFTQVLMRHLGAPLLATEPSTSMRRRLTRRLPAADLGVEQLDDLHAARLHAAEPVPAGTVVVGANVLHVTQDPDAALRRLRELAGPAGHVVVVTPAGEASVSGAAVFLYRHGAGLWHAVRFVGVHAAMAPLTMLSGLAADPGRALDACQRSMRTEHEDGLSVILTTPGL